MSNRLALALAVHLLSAVLLWGAAPWRLSASFNTSGTIQHGKEQVARFSTNYFLKDWRGGSVSRPDVRSFETGRLLGQTQKDGPKFTAELNVRQTDARTVRMDYRLLIHEQAELNTLYAGFVFPAALLAGQTYAADGAAPQPFPATHGATHLIYHPITTFTMTTPHGPLTVRFPKPTGFLLQDNRQWSDSFSLRLGNADDSTKTVKAGDANVFSFDLIFPQDVELVLPRKTVLTAGEDWIPLTPVLGIKKDSALDFSRFGFTDAPAGKHGRVRAVGQHFEFERLPGVSQRFYGVNFVGTGQYHSHERAAELAERLLRLGYNTVRFHHHERPVQPRDRKDSTQVDPQRLDQLHFFFAELKKRGIYVTTDLFVSRYVYNRDIWPGMDGDVSMDDYKKLLAVSRPALENLKQFTRNFLGARNPYTGMSMAEDPAMAWISLVNENTPSLSWARMTGPVKQEYLKAYNAWLTRKYGSAEARNRAWNVQRPDTLTDLVHPSQPAAEEERDFCLFLEERFKAMYDELKAFLRDELRCQALLTDMNFSTINSWTQSIRKRYDYIDHHFYIDHPSFLNERWRLPSSCPNVSVIARGELGGTWSGLARMFDRPFTISEYNYSGPGRYRGVGGILTGCLGAIQDWAAIWRFAYAHGDRPVFTPEVTNYFDMSKDPLNQCAERATLMLYLRQDLKPADKSIAITLSDDFTQTAPGRLPGSTVPSWRQLIALAQLGTAVGNDNLGSFRPTVTVPLDAQAPTAGTVVRTSDALGKEGYSQLIQVIGQQKWLPEGNRTDFSRTPFPRQTPNGEFTILPQEDTMLLDTERTAGGFAPAGTTLTTRALTARILDTDATVWASSLDQEPITASRHLLLTHLTDLVNTGMTFAEEARRTLLNWGKMPQLVRNGRAIVTFRHQNAAKITVWALRTDGERLHTLPVTRTPDGFQLELAVKGPDGARMLYEIVVD